MEQKENIRIEELLPRYCDGNVTMEERHWVEQWMAESEEHQKIVRQICTIPHHPHINFKLSHSIFQNLRCLFMQKMLN